MLEVADSPGWIRKREDEWAKVLKRKLSFMESSIKDGESWLKLYFQVFKDSYKQKENNIKLFSTVFKTNSRDIKNKTKSRTDVRKVFNKNHKSSNSIKSPSHKNHQTDQRTSWNSFEEYPFGNHSIRVGKGTGIYDFYPENAYEVDYDPDYFSTTSERKKPTKRPRTSIHSNHSLQETVFESQFITADYVPKNKNSISVEISKRPNIDKLNFIGIEGGKRSLKKSILLTSGIYSDLNSNLSIFTTSDEDAPFNNTLNTGFYTKNRQGKGMEHFSTNDKKHNSSYNSNLSHLALNNNEIGSLKPHGSNYNHRYSNIVDSESSSEDEIAHANSPPYLSRNNFNISGSSALSSVSSIYESFEDSVEEHAPEKKDEYQTSIKYNRPRRPRKELNKSTLNQESQSTYNNSISKNNSPKQNSSANSRSGTTRYQDSFDSRDQSRSSTSSEDIPISLRRELNSQLTPNHQSALTPSHLGIMPCMNTVTPSDLTSTFNSATTDNWLSVDQANMLMTQRLSTISDNDNSKFAVDNSHLFLEPDLVSSTNHTYNRLFSLNYPNIPQFQLDSNYMTNPLLQTQVQSQMPLYSQLNNEIHDIHGLINIDQLAIPNKPESSFIQTSDAFSSNKTPNNSQGSKLPENTNIQDGTENSNTAPTTRASSVVDGHSNNDSVSVISPVNTLNLGISSDHTGPGMGVNISSIEQDIYQSIVNDSNYQFIDNIGSRLPQKSLDALVNGNNNVLMGSPVHHNTTLSPLHVIDENSSEMLGISKSEYFDSAVSMNSSNNSSGKHNSSPLSVSRSSIGGGDSEVELNGNHIDMLNFVPLKPLGIKSPTSLEGHGFNPMFDMNADMEGHLQSHNEPSPKFSIVNAEMDKIQVTQPDLDLVKNPSEQPDFSNSLKLTDKSDSNVVKETPQKSNSQVNNPESIKTSLDVESETQQKVDSGTESSEEVNTVLAQGSVQKFTSKSVNQQKEIPVYETKKVFENKQNTVNVFELAKSFNTSTTNEPVKSSVPKFGTNKVGVSFDVGNMVIPKFNPFKTPKPVGEHVSIIPPGKNSPPEIHSDDEIDDEEVYELMDDLPPNPSPQTIIEAQKKAKKILKKIRNPGIPETPEWAKTPQLLSNLEKQMKVNPDKVFGNVKPIKVDEIFARPGSRIKQFPRGAHIRLPNDILGRSRQSSGVWIGSDALTNEEIEEYNKKMGFE
ncbi:hypothetical protein BB558_005049 [Smittium angustum]|uniref:Inner centromere protein ARK-binding domain-containing protein n=1 Tax=Smittium angustum TaxID=133377 RepID=A0A2U1J1I5_SMIAN|nr:hypothetical protein BB558_005049 [Smittium angustum]